jgi:SAM-dependent methyltransferase
MSGYGIADTAGGRYVATMNQAHLELLRSDDWRDVLRDLAFPFAFEGRAVTDLGDDVLEVGSGPGLTTDLLSAELLALTALELDPELAAELAARIDPTRVTVVEGDATAMPFDDDRFSGAASFTMLHHVPTVADQDRIFGEVCRVVRPGALFVANDSVASDDLAAFHQGDVYNPIDPASLADRLERAGFVDVEVRTNTFAWAARAHAPS